jgi:hypothetical protein
MRHTLTRAAGVSLLAAAVITPAIALATAPASATESPRCTTVVVDGSPDITTSGGGTATITDDGLIMSTPAQPSKVTYRYKLSNPVPFSDVSSLEYLTDRQPGATGVDTTVAAYKLGVDIQGDGVTDGTLVYEPYYNGTVTDAEQTHNALGVDRAGKWWYSAEPGNKQTLATFKAWTDGTGPVTFPAPEVVWFGVEQGTYNTGAITRVNRIRFAGDGVCKLVKFMLPKGVPTTQPPTATQTPTVKPTTKPPATTAPPTSTKPPVTTAPPTSTAPTTEPPTTGGGGGSDDDGGALPVTGPGIAVAAGMGIVAVGGGIAVLLVTRRRRARFIA